MPNEKPTPVILKSADYLARATMAMESEHEQIRNRLDDQIKYREKIESATGYDGPQTDFVALRAAEQKRQDAEKVALLDSIWKGEFSDLKQGDWIACVVMTPASPGQPKDRMETLSGPVISVHQGFVMMQVSGPESVKLGMEEGAPQVKMKPESAGFSYNSNLRVAFDEIVQAVSV